MALRNSQKVLGIVTEYNPFHNGHAYHIEASKSLSGADYVIAVMSPHFTQRGEPAIADPHTRAKWAIASGVDLVIALPTLFSTASAGYFAYGAVAILNALGLVDALCFGSESGDINQLKTLQTQMWMAQSEFKSAQLKDPSLSYQNHRDQFIKTQSESVNLSGSNDILGLAYMDALHGLSSPMTPLTIQRIQADYHEAALTGSISSATAIRSGIQRSKALSQSEEQFLINDRQPSNDLDLIAEALPLDVAQDLFSKEGSVAMPSLSLWQEWILFELRRSTLSQLSLIHDMAEGLPQRMKSKATEHEHYDHFENALKTKIYTTGRLKRVMAKLLLGITKADLSNDFLTAPEYVRILAFNEKGRQLLNQMDSNLPLITNAKHFRPATPSAARQWEIDCTASDLYHLLLKGSLRRGGHMFSQTPLYIKDGAK